MKKSFLLTVLASVLILILTIPVFAESHSVVGGKVDLPNLIRFTDNLTLGMEGGKKVYQDVFKNDGFWYEDDHGYFGYVKITWTGTLLDFSKK